MSIKRAIFRWQLIAVALLGLTAWLIFAFHPFGFPFDDSWIHLVYARCLWEHGQFCYNDGILATGDSSPFWVICISLLYGLAHHFSTAFYIATIDVFSAILYLGVIASAFRLTYEITHAEKAANWVAFFLCFNPLLLYHVFVGMEVYLCAILLLWSALGFIKKAYWKTGIFLALACCVRPESAVVGVVYWTYLLMMPINQKVSALAKILFPCLVLGFIWIAFNYHVSQHIFPAPYYFKETISSSHLSGRIFSAFILWLLVFPPLSIFSWFLLVSYFFKKKLDAIYSFITLPLWVGCSFVLFNAFLVGLPGYSLYLLRYVVPVVPFLIISVVIAAWILARLTKNNASFYYLFVVGIMSLGVAYDTCIFGLKVFDYVYTLNIAPTLWIRDHLPANIAVATSDAGIMRYYVPRFVIDTAGLNTPEFFWDHERFNQQHPVSLIYVWTNKLWYKTRAEDVADLIPLRRYYTFDQFYTFIFACKQAKIIHFEAIPRQAVFVRSFDVNCIPQQFSAELLAKQP